MVSCWTIPATRSTTSANSSTTASATMLLHLLPPPRLRIVSKATVSTAIDARNLITIVNRAFDTSAVGVPALPSVSTVPTGFKKTRVRLPTTTTRNLVPVR